MFVRAGAQKRPDFDTKAVFSIFSPSMCLLPRKVVLACSLQEAQGFPGGTSGEEPACQCRRHKKMRVRSLGLEDPLEEGKAVRSSILAWRIPWTEKPGGLLSMGSQRVRHN